ncbi:uroporphyrinogen-III synthase [Aeromicrobium sp. SORGH_AS_0981]|uniref:uroporphyrinogen-III synthase n=1 Tax=Aeromicrobium sp. SORGH_AS_0981 TaxID=3041802 RepID=UPI00286D3C79|nr:uroporphyrinogen-III synthase [Aeromicrobium sp. SORGH_AS_0981]
MNVLRPVLSGTTVLVTAQRRADELSGALQRRGAEVTTASALGVESHLDEAGLLAATRELVADPPDVLVVTTGIGFRGWLDTAEASGLGHDLVEALAQTRIVARGPKARGALQAAGLVPDWVAESETSAEIVQLLLTEGVDGLHVAVQHHGAGDDGIEKALQGGGAVTTTLVVYRWGPPPETPRPSSAPWSRRPRAATTRSCSPRRPARRRGSRSWNGTTVSTRCAAWSARDG